MAASGQRGRELCWHGSVAATPLSWIMPVMVGLEYVMHHRENVIFYHNLNFWLARSYLLICRKQRLKLRLTLQVFVNKPDIIVHFIAIHWLVVKSGFKKREINTMHGQDSLRTHNETPTFTFVVVCDILRGGLWNKKKGRGGLCDVFCCESQVTTFGS